MHFAAFMGQSGIGISYGSCNAAVAVQNNGMGFNHPYAPERNTINQMVNHNYNALANSNGFAAVFGNSRLYTGLDPDYNLFNQNGSVTPPAAYGRFSNSGHQQHAEQTAILEVQHRMLQFYQYGGHCHIYIDLIPCNSCMRWLHARPESWYVYYHYEGEQQTQQMTEFKQTFQDRYSSNHPAWSGQSPAWSYQNSPYRRS
jgi:hypothetical protein